MADSREEAIAKFGCALIAMVLYGAVIFTIGYVAWHFIEKFW